MENSGNLRKQERRRTPVWCLPKALRCVNYSQVGILAELFTIGFYHIPLFRSEVLLIWLFLDVILPKELACMESGRCGRSATCRHGSGGSDCYQGGGMIVLFRKVVISLYWSVKPGGDSIIKAVTSGASFVRKPSGVVPTDVTGRLNSWS